MSERMVEVVGWKDPIGEGLYNMGVTDERIVRCRDCRYGHQHDGKTYPKGEKYKGKWYCIVWGDGMQGEWTSPDGFCHRGKTRETSELLPCPFCGGDAKLDGEDNGWSVWHACDGPRGMAKDYHSLDVPEFRTPWYEDRQMAVNSWNRRMSVLTDDKQASD